jgi:tRNA pseudouridine55 synthase
MNGIIIINKPTGYTSRDIVNIISKKLKTKKVGHTGTLDPLASGVLVITIGRYTKLGEMLTSLDKEYISEIKLGINTDTLDITGNILEKKDFDITKEDIEKVFKKFIGKYEMEVPKYSAIKINGKKLYEYARNNEDIALPIKTVEVKDLELIDYQDDIIKFRTKVEKGTYIRSLIRDICKELNTIGTMNSLVRTKQGNFSLENAQELEDDYNLLKITDVLNVKTYNLNDAEYQKVINGNSLILSSNEEKLLLEYNNEEIAIYNKDNNKFNCNVMLKINTQDK